MTTAKLRKMVDEATPNQRYFLRAYLDHLARVNDPANAIDLSRRMAEMDAGKKVTLDQVKKLHAALEKLDL